VKRFRLLSVLFTLTGLALAAVLLAPVIARAEGGERPLYQNTTYPGAATTMAPFNPYPGPAATTGAPGTAVPPTLPFVTLTASPTQGPTDFASPTPGPSRTPLPTLEPVPSFEIIFPTQPADGPRLAAAGRDAQELVKGSPAQPAAERGPLGLLALILGVIWLVLGGLLVFTVRKLLNH